MSMMDDGVMSLKAARRELDKAHKAACAALARFQSVKDGPIEWSKDERIAARSLLDQTVPLCKAILCAMQAIPDVALPTPATCHLPPEPKVELPCVQTAAWMLQQRREKRGVVATSARYGKPILAAMSILLLCLVFNVEAASLPLAQRQDASATRSTAEEDVAWTLWAEARGEGFQGLEAVATVIVNRSAERGLSPAQVVRQPKQFSCWNGRASAGEGSGRVWFQCLELSRRICDGSFQPLENWNHYYNPRRCSPRWAVCLRNTAQINRHVFGTI